MNIINYDNGKKSYVINGDENCVITFNTSDIAIVDRIKKAMINIQAVAEDYEKRTIDNEDDINKLFVETDREIRNQIDYIFGDKIADKAFGATNCLSVCGSGNAIYENFLNAIVPIIEHDIISAQEKANKRIEKYTSQVKK
ncbi:MAG: hypothetical protein J1F17_06055 [Oscillospiraceae bacterium]|nr:hypothetical protein [Oscillospiraceae bacterium]